MTATRRTALVTGAGRGIGRGIAEILCERGIVVAVNDLHEDRAREVAAELGATGGIACAVPFDVTDADAVRSGLAGVESELGPVDILVSNAGVPEQGWRGPFAESSPEDWEPYVALNVVAPMISIRAVLPGMLERGWGRVIQISSGSAARGLPAGVGSSVYGASKAFVDALLRHVALEVARDGVTLNAVAPGLISSAQENAPPDVIERVMANVPIGRFGEPREIGSAVAWLCSDLAGYVTGQVIHVNGGSYQGR